MIPGFDESGLLPAGTHDCTLAEIKQRFGQFPNTDRRCELYERLQQFLSEAWATRQVVAVIVDGSFVTGRDDPGDIDLIVVLSPDFDYRGEVAPFEYNVLSRRRVQQRYGFDILVATENSSAYEVYLDFYQQVKGRPGRRKGMLRVRP
jgi:predicted nucleotidyltransferase